jgi:Flp pilus assembly protein TadD
LVGCSKRNANVERVAILPANMLVSDTSAQWLKIGIPLILQQDFMTAHDLIPGVTQDENTATQAKATQVLRTTVESRANGLHIESKLFDLKSQKVLQVKSVEAGSVAGIITAANALAKQLDANASAYSTGNSQALESYLAAASTNNRPQRVQMLQQAIRQDPNFGLAYISLLEMIAPHGQADPKPFLDEAKTHRDKFSAYDRAKFDLGVSRLLGAPAAEQIRQAQEALKLAPNDLEVLEILGTNQLLEGDGQAGEQTLRRAVSLNPSNAGLQIELGRGLMRERKLKEADAVFSALGTNAAVLPDLATCALLEGDKARANSLANQLFATVQNPDLKPLLAASWQFMSGEQQKGIDTLLNTKFATPNVEAVALSEAAIWQAMQNNYGGAKETLQRANASAGHAVSFPAVAALLIDRSGSAAEWQQRVKAAPLPPNVKEPLLAYGLFLRANYDDAATQWKLILDQSHGNDIRARAMLASSLDRAGKKSQAAQIKVMPFAPEFGDLYAAIPFAEMRRLLGL